MKDALLRQQKDRLLQPLVQRFFAAISPNLLSLLAVVPGLLSAYAIIEGWLGWALFLWLVNRFLDGLDGLVARVHDKKSDFGGYLDLLLDFVVYLAIPAAFVAAQPTSTRLWALVFLLASYQMNTLSWTLLSALFEKRTLQRKGQLTSVVIPVGLIEGTETILFYTLFFLLPTYVVPLFWVMGSLVFVTAGQRIWWAWHTLR